MYKKNNKKKPRNVVSTLKKRAKNDLHIADIYEKGANLDPNPGYEKLFKLKF